LGKAVIFARLPRCEEALKTRINIMAITFHFRGSGAGEKTAIRAWMARALGLVIGVETEIIIRAQTFVTGKKSCEYEFFEKPGGMGEMLFCRTGVVHGLYGLILGT